MDPLSDIVFETIDLTYARGRYGPFEVVLRRADSYINVTKLAKSGGKRFDNWLQNKGSQDLIAAVGARAPGAPAPVAIVKSGRAETRGTYVHPLLVPHIASWVSTDFAVKASEIVNAALVREYRSQLSAKEDRIAGLETLLRRVHATSESTGRRVEGLVSEVGSIRAQNEALVDEVRAAGRHNEALAETAACIVAAVNDVQDIALAAARDSVPPVNDPAKDETFALLAVSDERGGRALYVARCQARGLAAQVATRRRQMQAAARARAQKTAPELGGEALRRHQDHAAGRVRVETVFALGGMPNARQFWIRLQELAGDRVRSTGPTGIQLQGLTEREFEGLAREVAEEPLASCRAATGAVQQSAERAFQAASVHCISAPPAGAGAPPAGAGLLPADAAQPPAGGLTDAEVDDFLCGWA